MNLTKKIKAGVIGLGVGLHQARTLRESEDCELVSICDFDKSKLDTISSEFPSVNKTQNDQDILLDSDINLVCIASYDEFHYHQVITALNNGKHVYVEKPACLKHSELKDIYEKLKTFSNLKFSSNMVLRTCPLFNKVRNEILSKNMGDIYHLEADYLWGRKEKIISGWRAKADFYSIIHGAAVHMIDLILWIIGKKPIKVRALGSNIVVSKTKQKHNDFVIILLEFEDRLTVKISAHGGGIHPHFHALKIFGGKSTFIHDYAKTFWIESSNPSKDFKIEHSFYPAKKKRDQALKSFVNSLINAEDEPLISKKDVFDVMSICLAAEQAVKSGDNIYIEYL